MHDFSLCLTPGISNAIHNDQMIETTYMRLGHGPGGARGIAIDEKQMSIWALSFATCGELVQNLMNMTYNKDVYQPCNHKEESPQRILNDTIDRKNIQEYLSRIIDPMKPSSHPGGHLLNIVSGEMASEKTNTHEAVSLGIDLIHKFRSSWPEGFRVPIMKPIILMNTKRNSVKIGENKIYDQSFIYARTC